MKKALFSLLLGGIAAAAFAQTGTQTPAENTLNLGTHILVPNFSPACPAGTQNGPITATPIVIGLTNPNTVNGAQGTITFDATKVEFVDPANDPAGTPTCASELGGELRGTVLAGSPSAVINYANAGSGTITFALATANPTSTGGPLMTLYARVKGNPAPGTVIPFSINTSGSTAFKIATTGGAAGTAVPGTLIVGAATGQSDVGLGSVRGSVSTDGTNLYAVDDRGTLTVSPATGANAGNPISVGQIPGQRIGAPVAGRPVIRENRVVIVGTNGRAQAFDTTTANFKASYAAPAAGGTPPGVTLPSGASVFSTPAVVNGNIFVTDSAGNLYKVALATGAQTGNGAPVGAAATSSPAYVPGATAALDRIAVGGTNGVLIIDPATLAPVTTIPATGGSVSSTPYVGPDGIGWVGTDGGQVITFNVITGTQVGTPVDAGGPVHSPVYGSAIGAIAVNTSGKVTVVSPLGTAVGAGAQLNPPAGASVPAGQDLFGYQQSPIVRGTTLVVGDSIGNLYTASVDTTGTITGAAPTNYGSLPITAPASAGAGQVMFVAGRSDVLTTTIP